MAAITEIDKIERLGISPISEISEAKGDSLSIMQSKTEIFDSNIQEYISKELFGKSGFVANENWETNLNIQSRVTNINKESVECWCLIDKEKHYFEYRSFPINLFANITDLKNKQYLILNIKSKAGSIRIDVSDGEKRVEKSLFELGEKWDGFDTNDLNDSLDAPINI